MFLPKSSNLSGSKTAELFSRLLFQLPCDVSKQIYCYVFFVHYRLSMPEKCTGERRDLIRVHRFAMA